MISLGVVTVAQAFSSIQRSRYIQQLKSNHYDVLIIGGGVTGAGILLDAKSRGMKAALIEQNDFAFGTSSRSTKLIHGGLRYLKQLEMKLVAEVGRERAIVYENAPHVTTPISMLLPVYANSPFAKQALSLGLKMYDSLANVKRHERRKMLTVRGTLNKEPLLKESQLKGSGLYTEYQTDDARLTVEIIKKAVELGATALNYVEAAEFLYDENKQVSGVQAVCLETGQPLSIQAKKVVNATGPWVDTMMKKDNEHHEPVLVLTKGIHIVVDHIKFPIEQAIYFQAIDGRMIFAIPFQDVVYIGTTDTFYDGDLSEVAATRKECLYLLESVMYMFPNILLTLKDIISSWAGIRPLIKGDKKEVAEEISRKDELFISDSQLITIAGGKLTGYRKMSERVVNLMVQQFTKEGYQSFGKCQTEKLPLSGGDVGGSEHFQSYIEEKHQVAKKIGMSDEIFFRLIHRYGSNIDALFQRYEYVSEESTFYDIPADIFVEFVYGIEEEMVTRVEDFLIRRTSALSFYPSFYERYKDGLLAYMAHRFHWDEEKRKEEAARLLRMRQQTKYPFEC